MRNIIQKFENWKEENPDKDYQRDEIIDFLMRFSRDDIIELMNFSEKCFNFIRKTDI